MIAKLVTNYNVTKNLKVISITQYYYTYIEIIFKYDKKIGTRRLTLITAVKIAIKHTELMIIIILNVIENTKTISMYIKH